jgi:CheY-like chemotaxis protein
MIVDDESDIAKIMARALRMKGLQVVVFTDPVKALEEFKKNNSNDDDHNYDDNNIKDHNFSNNNNNNDRRRNNSSNNNNKKKKTYSLILSDIRMPVLNGYDLVKEMKAIDPKVRAILMSAFEYNVKGLSGYNTTTITSSIGIADSFIEKPVSMAKVQEIVLDTIRRSFPSST